MPRALHGGRAGSKDHNMKITKSQLRHIIKETINEYNGASYTPEQQAVVDAMNNLTDLIYDMEESDPEMTDSYIRMLRALAAAGVNIQAMVRFA